MLMVFSENRTSKTVKPMPTTIRMNTQAINPSFVTQVNLQENMFSRLQNVKKCTNCGK